MKSIGEINVDIAAIREMLASKSGVAVFVSEMSGSELVNGLMSALDSDGSRIVSVEAGDSYMDYIAPLLETEDGDTVILDGVQNVDKSLIADFLRIISDRVLVGTIGEGDNAQSFEMPMNNFKLVLIDRGGGGAMEICCRFYLRSLINVRRIQAGSMEMGKPHLQCLTERPFWRPNLNMKMLGNG